MTALATAKGAGRGASSGIAAAWLTQASDSSLPVILWWPGNQSMVVFAFDLPQPFLDQSKTHTRVQSVFTCWRQVFVYARMVLAVCVGYGVLPNSLDEHNTRWTIKFLTHGLQRRFWSGFLENVACSPFTLWAVLCAALNSNIHSSNNNTRTKNNTKYFFFVQQPLRSKKANR